MFSRAIFDSDDQKNEILAPLIDCDDPGRIVSGEPNIHIGCFNKTEQFSIDVSFNKFYSKAKSRQNELIFDLFMSRAFSRNGHWVFLLFRWTFYRLAKCE